MGQGAGRGRVGVIYHEAQRVLPAAQDAQAVELVLFEDMGGEAVGIGPRGPLGVGQQIDFTVRLLEGLDDAARFQRIPPAQNRLWRGANRMPQTDRRFVRHPIQRLARTS